MTNEYSFRVLVCGGRDLNDFNSFCRIMDNLNLEIYITCIISGAARGADTMAYDWSHYRGVPIQEFPADWSLGRKAGPIRNKQMITEGKPDLVIAFPGGKGTANMIHQAGNAGLKIYQPLGTFLL